MPDQTKKNLQEAFGGESRANRLYLAFSEKAAHEGFPNIAKLFRVVAESETIHALNHLRAIGAVKSTRENAETALKGEMDEINDMYPMFMDQAQRDRNNDALKTFYWANEAEKTHAEFYERAVGALKQGQDLEVKDLFICSVCGWTVEGTPPEKCPICGESRDKFRLPD
jgi:rubrerythrin